MCERAKSFAIFRFDFFSLFLSLFIKKINKIVVSGKEVIGERSSVVSFGLELCKFCVFL